MLTRGGLDLIFLPATLLSSVIFASFLPSLGIMFVGYLDPNFCKTCSQTGPTMLDIGNIVYVVGAVLAGLTTPKITDRIRLVPILLLIVGVFTLVMVANLVLFMVTIFMASFSFQRWDNAGSRVVRNTFMLETVPNESIWQVILFFSAFERLLFLAIATHQVATTDPKSGYWMTGKISLCSAGS